MSHDSKRLKTRVPSSAEQQRLLDELRAIRERSARLPILDTRSDEEIIGYDEYGIPN